VNSISRSAIVNRSAADMYALVDDVESYPRFLPWCREARVQQEGGGKRATLVAGLGGVQQSFTTLNRGRPGEAIDMTLVDGPFRHLEGAWRFTPLSAQACRVDFSMRYELAGGPLAKLLSPLFAEIADTMVDAFTRRAEEARGDPR
jgi:ribosome-associated toxin RatA of RatAB toxin-antitoxin module